MELPVIMATTTPPIEELALNPQFEPIVTLTKPYATEQLLGTVKDVLRGVFHEKQRRPRGAGVARTLQPCGLSDTPPAARGSGMDS